MERRRRDIGWRKRRFVVNEEFVLVLVLLGVPTVGFQTRVRK